MPKPHLSKEIVIAMRREAKRGMLVEEIAKMCGVSIKCARDALRGYTWGCVDVEEQPLGRYESRYRQPARDPQRKLTPEAIEGIKAMRDYGYSGKAIGAIYGVSDTTVFRVLRGETYKWVGATNG